VATGRCRQRVGEGAEPLLNETVDADDEQPGNPIGDVGHDDEEFAARVTKGARRRSRPEGALRGEMAMARMRERLGEGKGALVRLVGLERNKTGRQRHINVGAIEIEAVTGRD